MLYQSIRFIIFSNFKSKNRNARPWRSGMFDRLIHNHDFILIESLWNPSVANWKGWSSRSEPACVDWQSACALLWRVYLYFAYLTFSILLSYLISTSIPGTASELWRCSIGQGWDPLWDRRIPSSERFKGRKPRPINTSRSRVYLCICAPSFQCRALLIISLQGYSMDVQKQRWYVYRERLDATPEDWCVNCSSFPYLFSYLSSLSWGQSYAREDRCLWCWWVKCFLL